MTHITKLAGNDDTAEERCLLDEDGAPREREFSHAVQMWAICQGRAVVTVQEAALAFNATPEVIRQAVEAHYWMYLDGDRIEHEGA